MPGLNKDKTNIVALPFAISSEEGKLRRLFESLLQQWGHCGRSQQETWQFYIVAARGEPASVPEKHYAGWLDKLSH